MTQLSLCYLLMPQIRTPFSVQRSKKKITLQFFFYSKENGHDLFVSFCVDYQIVWRPRNNSHRERTVERKSEKESEQKKERKKERESESVKESNV